MPTPEAIFAILACSQLATAPVDTTFPSVDPVRSPACFVDDGNTAFADPTPTNQPVSWRRGRTTTYVPSGFWSDNGTYDLLIHFHGAQTRTEPAFQSAGFEHAVLVTVNLGVGSGPYEDRFAHPAAFPDLLASIERDVAKHEPLAKLRVGRVALSGWSAGYGAIKHVLAHEQNRNRIDAVLLADGLHAGFVAPRGRTIFAPLLAPFVAFAEQAAEGAKLMAIAHSSIRTSTYASTTETARYLSEAVGVEPEPVENQRIGSMEMRSRTEHRGLRIHGFEGQDAAAHVDHLAHIDGTLYSQLRGWWSVRVANGT